MQSEKVVLITGPNSTNLPLFSIDKEAVFNDIEMGVLANGMPYLSLRGLAKLCGINHSALVRFTQEWPELRHNSPRGKKINQILEGMGYNEDYLYVKAKKDGQEVNAFVEPVCMALLEYYALDVKDPKEDTVYNYRTLARIGFRSYIYKAVGYITQAERLNQWRHFHDRVDLTKNSVPQGYFCVFREIASLLVPMLTQGVPINERIIPDISVGILWAAFWKNNNLEVKYGPKIKFEHNYPSYYPQSKSNPQEASAYPNEALGEFRNWFEKTYTVQKFPKYISDKVRKNQIGLIHANELMNSLKLPPLISKAKVPLEN